MTYKRKETSIGEQTQLYGVGFFAYTDFKIFFVFRL